MSNKTTVPCKKGTRKRLKAKGRKGESYDELLNRLLDTLEEIEEE